MTAKELKRMVNMIPDEAIITICGNPYAEIKEFTVENWPGYILANITLTGDYFLASETVIKKWMEDAAYRK